jgi:hypothetical protein
LVILYQDYYSTLRNTPEEHIPHQHRNGSLKSRTNLDLVEFVIISEPFFGVSYVYLDLRPSPHLLNINWVRIHEALYESELASSMRVEESNE